MTRIDLDELVTEQRNPHTMNLDEFSLAEACRRMNAEDQTVAGCVQKQLPQIEQAVAAIINAFNQKGRLIYLGAGTSGRLGVLDAAECVPTFGVAATQVVGLIAGGPQAMTKAVEGAEDSLELASQDLKKIQLTAADAVVGIAASGRTPYVIGGLNYAREVGAATISLACNRPAQISQFAQIAIEIDCGPEFLTGSTRLKAGTAQKMTLNMLSTLSMVGIGKVYNNLMVDVLPTNAKLVERSKRIIMDACGVDYHTAAHYFEQADGQVKVALVMLLTKCSKEKAKQKLAQKAGFVKRAVNEKD
ncbi:N-acetylmuramic acid 6-phosphate etherase [Liquorilactobacillus satsumensis]|uniref:N-acetylmuramic acid 6-phosphate etherase n=1 Tax=Liquorilactobacillus satsumensis DSM 16230 = JCM 12392 TaxID=1423801 RepID=A0A0R1UZZ1_9LACO|nr:N-acetylmuramic acid 6-phosphate etherase [Liquorilactobacillus satsumensis]KRL98766.1 N-acetylmuramic acid-6-phosphate etherase [Liquorilactobacillus satsumensis DSM 16230 = JCM 12392]MCC7667257.1 N-acetylmuramic acid 6-phosphate etherase [Liquorilactobacillus satsumensis]MCP9328053.1 N-acetylmuramic acid 6-phosphate etherase [Liquorilactobacillus satsumensis]MCP9358587.1 N-acetylmuramic acid 6-phosphate etherase [Liquorilactobacillus satsumensis]MCP9372538.1 N-acetylmuramic acid 6-phospha